MDLIRHDLLLAARSLARRPGLTAAALLTVSLGVGAVTSIFSVLYGVVIRPLPYFQPEQLVRVSTVGSSGGPAPWSGANYLDFEQQSSTYQAIAGFEYADYSMRSDDFPVKVTGATVTADFFEVFGVQPVEGQTFAIAETPGGSEPAVVLGYGFWQTQFAGKPILGMKVDLNDRSYSVVGIMPPDFAYPTGAEIWVASRYRVPEPTRSQEEDPAVDRSSRYFRAVARLKPEKTLDEANAEGSAFISRIASQNPDSERGFGFEATSLHESVTGKVRPLLMVLFGSVGLVLLIACANVANLLLAKAISRTHEIAIHTALGASRLRLVRQVLVESTLLGIGGGVGGVLLSFWGTGVLVSMADKGVPRAADISVNPQVLLFALAVSIFSGLVFGLVPALWLSGRDSARALIEAGGRILSGTHHARLRAALVTIEIAVSLTLLVGAGLLMRAYSVLSTTDPGFSASNLLTADVWLASGTELTDDEIRILQDEILARSRTLPGVVSAGAVLSLPIGVGISARATYSVEGTVLDRGTEPAAGLQAASPGYFESIGIPVLRGRAFTADDRADSPPVAVVSEAFAKQILGDEDPVGRRIGTGNPEEDDFQWLTVVGVVGNTRYDGLEDEPRSEAFQPFAQAPWPYMTLVLQTSVEPMTLADPLRRAVMKVKPDQPVAGIATMDQLMEGSLARRRDSARLVGIFAFLALVLAAIGLYGVMSYSVASRTREIGIRMAIGAERRDIFKLVLGDGGRLLAIGLVAGATCAAVLGQLIRRVLYGVPPTDPVVYAVAACVLALAALLAMLLPARRAALVEPADCLRSM
jgi:putative ABC transport system permease protein